MAETITAGVAAGIAVPLLWKLAAWFWQRDQKRHDQEIHDLWSEVGRLRDEQATLRERVAGLPARPEFERLEQKLDDLRDKVLAALSR